ncbi:uncharacterized protein LOC131028878 isoform X2 [Cryptomeria japonica]|uniref:uncharacterized protein LOC131028878 isoform X2 n=1 Tax=Cryptomeria japonica TaxID=3369 RepID=UPI0025AD9AAC|nr:uncharacterized protein LOC131028878 isoform X2 [Cryptomeria japonica]
MGGIQCSICLELVNGEAYLDQCFHRFCYHCILQWAEMLFNKQSDSLPCLLCPLCKVKNSSIIHNFVGSTFQRHYISKLPEKSFVMSEAHYRRLQIYSEPPDAACSNVQALKHWDRYGNLQSSCWLQCWIRRELQSLMQEIAHRSWKGSEKYLHQPGRRRGHCYAPYTWNFGVFS